MPALRQPQQLRSQADLTKLMTLKGFNNDRSLAEAAKLHHSTVHRIRTDPDYRTHLDTATALADALGVEVAALFRSEGQNGPTQAEK